MNILILLLISALTLPALLYLKFKFDDAECSHCGFIRKAHSNKDVQWHPDHEPCNKFTNK